MKAYFNYIQNKMTKKWSKIDILLHFWKAVKSKWMQVQRCRLHYWLFHEKPFNLVVYFHWIGASNVDSYSKKWKEPKFPSFTPLQNDPHYHSCLKGYQISTKTGKDMRISPLVRAWNVLQFPYGFWFDWLRKTGVIFQPKWPEIEILQQPPVYPCTSYAAPV